MHTEMPQNGRWFHPAPSMTMPPLPFKPLLLAGLLLAAAPSFAQPGAPSRAGTYKDVVGEVFTVRGAHRLPAQPGDALQAADTVLTGETGSAAIVLRDGTELVVGPRSNTTLVRYAFDATTQEGNMLVQLLRGSLRYVTGLIGKLHPGKTEIKTPTLVVGVRGTDFIVETP